MATATQLQAHKTALTGALSSLFLEIGNAYYAYNKARLAPEEIKPAAAEKQRAASAMRIRKAQSQCLDTLDQLDISILRAREIIERIARQAQQKQVQSQEQAQSWQEQRHDGIKMEDYPLLEGADQHAGGMPMTIIDLEGKRPSGTPRLGSDGGFNMTPAAQTAAPETPAGLTLDTGIGTSTASLPSGGLSAVSAGNALTFLQALHQEFPDQEMHGQAGDATTGTAGQTTTAADATESTAMPALEGAAASELDLLTGFDQVDTSMFSFFEENADFDLSF